MTQRLWLERIVSLRWVSASAGTWLAGGLFTRLSWLIPVLAVTSCLGLAFPKIGVLFAVLRDVYTALVVLWYAELMVEMIGGFHSACVAIASRTIDADADEARALDGGGAPSSMRGAASSSIPMDDIAKSSDLLVAVWHCVSQYAYLNSVLGVLWTVLAGLGWYEEGILPDHWLLRCLKVLQLVSAFIAVGAATVQYRVLHGPLMRNKFSSTFKLLLVLLAVIFCNCQPFVLSLLFLEGDIPNTAMFATRARSALWNCMLLAVETLALLLLLVKAFPLSELFDPEVRAPLTGEVDWDRFSMFPVQSYGSVGRPARFTTSALQTERSGQWSGRETKGGGGVVAARSSYPQYESGHV